MNINKISLYAFIYIAICIFQSPLGLSDLSFIEFLFGGFTFFNILFYISLIFGILRIMQIKRYQELKRFFEALTKKEKEVLLGRDDCGDTVVFDIDFLTPAYYDGQTYFPSISCFIKQIERAGDLPAITNMNKLFSRDITTFKNNLDNKIREEDKKIQRKIYAEMKKLRKKSWEVAQEGEGVVASEDPRPALDVQLIAKWIKQFEKIEFFKPGSVNHTWYEDHLEDFDIFIRNHLTDPLASDSRLYAQIRNEQRHYRQHQIYSEFWFADLLYFCSNQSGHITGQAIKKAKVDYEKEVKNISKRYDELEEDLRKSGVVEDFIDEWKEKRDEFTDGSGVKQMLDEWGDEAYNQETLTKREESKKLGSDYEEWED